MLKEHAAGHGHQAVAGQIHLIVAVGVRDGEVPVRDALGGNERENLTVIERGGDVVDLRADGERQSDKGQQIKVSRCLDNPQQGLSGPVKEDSVREKIVAAAARKRKLREHKDLDALLCRRTYDLDHPLGVIVRVRDPDDGGSGCNLYKPVLHAAPPDQSRMRSAM